jgi:hypothetical protein
MLKNKNLSASDARKIAKAKTKDSSALLEEVLSQIEAESENGGTRLILPELSANISTELRMRGFVVDRLLYRTSFQIKWD